MNGSRPAGRHAVPMVLIVATMVVLPELVPPVAIVLAWRRVLGRGWWRHGVLAIATLAAVAWATPFLLQSDVPRAASAFLEVVLVGVVFAAFAALPPGARRAGPVITGALVGLALGAVASLFQVAAFVGVPFGDVLARSVPWGVDPLVHPGRAVGWLDHPNVWAARMVLPAVLVAAVAIRPSTVAGAQVLALVGIVAAGGRGAAAALILGTVAALVARAAAVRPEPRRGRAPWLAVAAALTVAAAISVLVVTPLGTRLDPRTVVQGLLAAAGAGGREGSAGAPVTPGAPHNLLSASEDLDTDRAAWKPQGVTVVPAPGGTRGTSRTWVVTKLAPAPDARVYQEVVLQPGARYVLSFAHRDGDPEAVPGVAGWGRAHGEAPHDTLNVRRGPAGWAVRVEGAIVAAPVEVTSLGDGWDRVVIGFTYAGAEPLTWRVGPTPDQRAGAVGTAMLVHSLQLEHGDAAGPYVPTWTADGIRSAALDAVARRQDVWTTAWRGFTERPLAGVVGTAPERVVAASHLLPAGHHGHNLVLAPLYDRGLLGAGAILALLAAVAVAGRRGGSAAVGILVAVVALNAVDYTLWTAGVAYPMAAAVGWAVARGASPRSSP